MRLRWKIAQAAEISWWKRYLHKKSKKEYLKWKKDYWKTFLETIQINIGQKDTVIDVGCGPAGMFIFLTENPVTAVDPLLEKYNKELTHFNPLDYPNTNFISTAIETLDLQTTFDVVFCLNAINHVSELDASIDKLITLLKPEGTLVFSIDAHNYRLFKGLFRLLPGDILHPHQYDLQEYKDMLTNRGLSIIGEHLIDKQFFFDYYTLVAKFL